MQVQGLPDTFASMCYFISFPVELMECDLRDKLGVKFRFIKSDSGDDMSDM